MTATQRKWHAGEALQGLVETGRLNVEAVAPTMGITSRTLYRWFKLDRLPERIAEQCASFFGVRVEWLNTGRGDKYESQEGGAGDVTRRVEQLRLRYERELVRVFRNYSTQVLKVVN